MNLRTPTATVILGVAGMVLVAALGWLFLVGPVTGSLGDARGEGAALSERNATMTAQVRGLESQRDGLSKIRALADELGVMFPPTADQPRFFRTVAAAAFKAGIGPKDITTLSPTAPVAQMTGTPATVEERTAALAQSELAVQSVTITVETSYVQARDLLANLERMDRSLLVQSVSVSGDGEGGKVVVSISGSTFVAPPVPAPDLGPDSPKSGD